MAARFWSAAVLRRFCAPEPYHSASENPCQKKGDFATLPFGIRREFPVLTSFYAHTAQLPDGSPDPDESHWQPLATHLGNVAALAIQRRLERGRWFYTPRLGWKELVPDYVAPLREGTAPCATENDGVSTRLRLGSGEAEVLAHN